MEKLGIWAIVLAVAFLAGTIFTGTMAFADDDDDDDRDNDDRDHDDRKKDKTLESECAKKLRKKNLNLDGLFCQAIIAIQVMLDMVKEIVEDHETRIMALEEGPAGLIEMQVNLFSEFAIRSGIFFGVGNDSDMFFSASPARISFGPGTITGFELEVISARTEPVDARLYLDGVSTSIFCTVLAGELGCSANGSVPAPIGSEIAIKNDGTTTFLSDPTAFVTVQLG